MSANKMSTKVQPANIFGFMAELVHKFNANADLHDTAKEKIDETYEILEGLSDEFEEFRKEVYPSGTIDSSEQTYDLNNEQDITSEITLGDNSTNIVKLYLDGEEVSEDHWDFTGTTLTIDNTGYLTEMDLADGDILYFDVEFDKGYPKLRTLEVTVEDSTP